MAEPFDLVSDMPESAMPDCEYSLVCEAVDPELFPARELRHSVQSSMGKNWVRNIAAIDEIQSEPVLVDQISNRILPKRGLVASAEEVLIVGSAQAALSLLVLLLDPAERRFAVEDPGPPEARHVLRGFGATVVPCPVDGNGLVVDSIDADVAVVSPSHQVPTGVPMALARRQSLLNWADENSGFVIEYETGFERNLEGQLDVSLKALDRSNRVALVGCLSRTLGPGLSLGYIVASKEIVKRAASLSRRLFGDQPGLHQRLLGHFLKLGYYEKYLDDVADVYRTRWNVMDAAISRHFPDWSPYSGFGATSFWLVDDTGTIDEGFATAARGEGVAVEPGSLFFTDGARGRNAFRIGFAAIQSKRIDDAVARLASVAKAALSR